jgi:hypothetical protein
MFPTNGGETVFASVVHFTDFAPSDSTFTSNIPVLYDEILDEARLLAASSESKHSSSICCQSPLECTSLPQNPPKHLR